MAGYSFFSSAHGIFFTKMDRTLGYETSLPKILRIKIIKSMFSNHRTIRLFRGEMTGAHSLLVTTEWLKLDMVEA